MHRVGAALQGGADVLLGVEVRADLDGLVGRARMQRAGVVGCDHRDGAMPSACAARKMRSAISPRFATSTVCTGRDAS